MLRSFAVASVIASLLFACGSQPGQGDMGRLHFQYQTGNLFSGANPWRAMLIGTNESITVQETRELPLLTPSVANASIVAITGNTSSQNCCTQSGTSETCSTITPPTTVASCHGQGGTVETYNVFQVTAVGAGDTVLTMTQPDGTTYDTITVSVKPAASLTVSVTTDAGTQPAVNAVTVAVGDQTLEFRASAFDAAQEQLEARFGITATTSNSSIVGVRESTLFPGPFTTSVNSFDVSGNPAMHGMATVTFSAMNAMQTVAVTVQ